MKIHFQVRGVYYRRLSSDGSRLLVYREHITQSTIKRLWRLWNNVDSAGIRIDVAYFNWR